MPPGSFDAGKPFTVEFWYRRDGDLKASAGPLQMGDLNLVFKYDAKDAVEQSHCQLFSAATGTAWNAKTELPEDRSWHHVAVAGDAGKVDVCTMASR